MNIAMLSGIYAITDPKLLPDEHLISGAEAALKGGVRILQYRNKPASSALRLQQAKSLVSLCQDYAALLIINDDPELCLRSGAGGVHLGRSDANLEQAQCLLGEDYVIGVTCHSDLAYAQACHKQGAHYCAFGRLFASQTKPEAPACQLSTLEQARAAKLRSVAIGGINHSNIDTVLNTGTDMVALIHGLFGQEDIEASARALCKKFDRSKA